MSMLVMKPNAVVSSRLSSGWTVAALNGACCRRSTASGTASTSASPAGVTPVSGKRCSSTLPRIPIWNISSSTARSSAPILAQLAPKKRGGQAEQALGRSRGGFSTKIHISVDGLGNPLRFRLTGGQRHDITQAPALIEGLSADYVIADKAYDAADFLDLVFKSGAESVIPSTPRRNEQREHDRHLYKERHLVECFINKIKHYRRVFSRFEKLASRYLGFLQLTAVLIWLR